MTSIAERTAETKFDPYTSEQVADLILGSFRFSRGHIGLQKEIVGYLASRFGDRMQSGVSEGVLNFTFAMRRTGEMALQVLQTQKAHPDVGGDLEDRTKSESRKIYRALVQAIDGVSEFDSVEELAWSLMIQDENRHPDTIKKIEGRALSPIPYKSNVVHHGLLGKPTGYVEYDQMFLEVWQAVQAQLEIGEVEMTQRIHPLIADYAARFPKELDD